MLGRNATILDARPIRYAKFGIGDGTDHAAERAKLTWPALGNFKISKRLRCRQLVTIEIVGRYGILQLADSSLRIDQHAVQIRNPGRGVVTIEQLVHMADRTSRIARIGGMRVEGSILRAYQRVNRAPRLASL